MSNLILMAAGLILLYIVSPLASQPVFLNVFFYVIPYIMWTKRYTIWTAEVGNILRKVHLSPKQYLFGFIYALRLFVHAAQPFPAPVNWESRPRMFFPLVQMTGVFFTVIIYASLGLILAAI
ncbi:hypothetical protein [Planomicrobium sp. YIM 101495]|uniref:hypothetical protein n=1 Tax=Planomicrobium sp. YIM 101495 TaxID=2665160 RepID=UPI0018AA074A|nr:hypothetical protein [Planomicrobium sp. YIM 101495]